MDLDLAVRKGRIEWWNGGCGTCKVLADCSVVVQSGVDV